MIALGRFTGGANVLLEIQLLRHLQSRREQTTNVKTTTQMFQ